MTITEDLLRAYEEDRLDRQRRGIVAAHLLAHPQEAAPVLERMLLNQAMGALGADTLLEPVPARLGAALRQAVRRTATG